MQIRGTDLIIDEFAAARQLAHIVAGKGFSVQGFLSPFSPFTGTSRLGVVSSANDLTRKVELRGDHKFSSGDDFVEIGNTGVKIKVSDLTIASEDSEAILDGRRYYTDTFYEKAHLVIEGTDGVDKISLTQDDKGNTIVEVSKSGVVASINAGSIAGVSLRLGDGDDILSIKADNYFGGVEIDGGAGADRLDAYVSYALKAGLAISGGDGADKISIRGSFSGLQVDGAEGADRIDAGGWEYSSLTKYIAGGAGADLIFGGTGGEIHGGAGADLISMRGGQAALYGGEGDDVIYGGEDADRMYGGDGADIIDAGAGDDFVDGGSGNDLIMGGAGSDWLIGGTGDDALYGGGFMGSKPVKLHTGAVEIPYGFDILVGGAGADSFWPVSRSPSDIAAYTGTGAAVLDFEPGVDVIA